MTYIFLFFNFFLFQVFGFFLNYTWELAFSLNVTSSQAAGPERAEVPWSSRGCRCRMGRYIKTYWYLYNKSVKSRFQIYCLIIIIFEWILYMWNVRMYLVKKMYHTFYIWSFLIHNFLFRLMIQTVILAALELFGEIVTHKPRVAVQSRVEQSRLGWFYNR